MREKNTALGETFLKDSVIYVPQPAAVSDLKVGGQSTVRVLFVFGTRPELIKMAPVIRLALRNPRFEVVVCSTGQHREMLASLLDLFQIQPDIDFALMQPGQSLTQITVGVLERMSLVLTERRPDWVFVQGDTTTAMAASLAAFYAGVPVAHIEAGLRTGDTHSPFPEEFNRRVTALVARFHFAPTVLARNNLCGEGILPARIAVCGNTGVDALMMVDEMLRLSPSLHAKYQTRFAFLDPGKKLLLLTVHRRESFGPPLRSILSAIKRLAVRDDVEILMPLHLNPNVRREVQRELGSIAAWAEPNSPRGAAKIWLTEPQDYLAFVYLMRASYFIITDSGGIQEEAPSLGKPVLVVREKTERPEAVTAGTSRLVGTSCESLLREAARLLDEPTEYAKMARAHNPYGDGQASARILEAIGHAQELSL